MGLNVVPVSHIMLFTAMCVLCVTDNVLDGGTKIHESIRGNYSCAYYQNIQYINMPISVSIFFSLGGDSHIFELLIIPTYFTEQLTTKHLISVVEKIWITPQEL